MADGLRHHDELLLDHKIGAEEDHPATTSVGGRLLNILVILIAPTTEIVTPVAIRRTEHTVDRVVLKTMKAPNGGIDAIFDPLRARVGTEITAEAKNGLDTLDVACGLPPTLTPDCAAHHQTETESVADQVTPVSPVPHPSPNAMLVGAAENAATHGAAHRAMLHAV